MTPPARSKFSPGVALPVRVAYLTRLPADFSSSQSRPTPYTIYVSNSLLRRLRCSWLEANSSSPATAADRYAALTLSPAAKQYLALALTPTSQLASAYQRSLAALLNLPSLVLTVVVVGDSDWQSLKTNCTPARNVAGRPTSGTTQDPVTDPYCWIFLPAFQAAMAASSLVLPTEPPLLGYLELTQPVVLDQVMVATPDADLFELGQTDPTAVVQLLERSTPLVHQGAERQLSVLAVGHDHSPTREPASYGDASVQFLHCQPVRQGVVTADTQLVMTHSYPATNPTLAAGASGVSEATKWYIGPDFLRRAALASESDLLSDTTYDSESDLATESDCHTEASVAESPVATWSSPKAIPFSIYIVPNAVGNSALPLKGYGVDIPDEATSLQGTPPALQDSLRSVPEPTAADSCVWVGLAALAALGVQHGDWVLVDTVHEHPVGDNDESDKVGPGHRDHEAQSPVRAQCRFERPCRILALEPVIHPMQDNPFAVGMTPILAYNLGVDAAQVTALTIATLPGQNPIDTQPSNPATVQLRRYTFRSHGRQAAPEDTAEGPTSRIVSVPARAARVTLARVASPSTDEEPLHEAALVALQRYLRSAGDLVVRTGDVLPVWVAEEDAAAHARWAEPDLAWSELVVDAAGSVAATSGAVLYFQVSALEPAAGNYYRIHSDHTEVVQTGRVSSFVPGVWARYADLSRSLPPAPPALGTPSTPSAAPFPAYNELRDTVTAYLATTSHLSRDILPTILLHGGPGSGKTTAIDWVAETLGLHVYTVSVADLIRDHNGSPAALRTTLGTYADRAARYAPCLLVLRQIGFLASAGEALETGQDPPAVHVMREVLEDLVVQTAAKAAAERFPVVVVATTDGEPDRIPPALARCFTREISVTAPGEEARRVILAALLRNLPVARDVSLGSVARETAAFLPGDLAKLTARACRGAWDRAREAPLLPDAGMARRADDDESDANDYDDDNGGGDQPLRRHPMSIRPWLLAGAVLTAADWQQALAESRSEVADSLGVPKIPTVAWSDVGGLASVKRDILDTVQLPLDHPELFATGVKKRSGILLYGPPGTGKTLLAKAVATSCSLNFFSVKGPELLNMYIGESEANVRRVFQRARDARPCVVFFDELDSLAPKRGQQGDSGGVMDRIVSQLLAELDGMSAPPGGGGDADDAEGGGPSPTTSPADIFVIGATNRPDLLDPALLRPGRFDKMVYLGISETHEAQTSILEALTRKFHLDPALNLADIAARCPFNYTGADFYALCSDAMLKAMIRRVDLVREHVDRWNTELPVAPTREAEGARDAEGNLIYRPTHHPRTRKPLPVPMPYPYYLEHLATEAETDIVVGVQDFTEALDELVPSVPMSEIERYKALQSRFSQHGAGEAVTGKVADGLSG